MGIDVQTNRCHIGSFKQSPGLGVVVLNVCVNNHGWQQVAGAVSFIGELLLMSGIEANPGPLDSPAAATGGRRRGGGKKDIRTILKENGLEKYADLFEAQEISPQNVEDMTSDDFKTLGIDKMGIRLNIIKACKRDLKANTTEMDEPFKPKDGEMLAENISPLPLKPNDRRPEMTSPNNDTVPGRKYTNLEGSSESAPSQDHDGETIPTNEEIRIKDQYKQAVKNAFENNGGVAGVAQYLHEQINEWKEKTVCIGVIGRSKVGKSSFINVLIGKTAEDEGAATVGVVETTMTVTEYHHAKNEKIILCDLPGVGTPNYPREKYLEAVDVNRYDLFILVTADTFMQDDLWLANEIKKIDKHFIFVRTKVGQSIRDDKLSKPKHYCNNKDAEKTLVKDIRNSFKDKLSSFDDGTHSKIVYLVDSYETKHSLLDFDKLLARIVDESPHIKGEAFTATIGTMAQEVIICNYLEMKGKLTRKGLYAGLRGAATVLAPDLSKSWYIDGIRSEIEFQRKLFGLDLNENTTIMNLTKLSAQKIIQEAKLQSGYLDCTRKGIQEVSSRVTEPVQANPYYTRLIPIVSLVLFGKKSYATTVDTVGKILDIIQEDAIKLNKFVCNFLLSNRDGWPK